MSQFLSHSFHLKTFFFLTSILQMMKLRFTETKCLAKVQVNSKLIMKLFFLQLFAFLLGKIMYINYILSISRYSQKSLTHSTMFIFLKKKNYLQKAGIRSLFFTSKAIDTKHVRRKIMQPSGLFTKYSIFN